MTETEQLIITKYDLFYESRLTKTETTNEVLKEDMRDIKRDLRLLLGVMLSFSGIMLGLMSKGFHWL